MLNTQPIVIALAADLGYQTQVETLIKSLAYHHTKLKIYLFHKTFPEEWFEIWNEKLALIGSEIISITVLRDFSTYQTRAHITEVSFYRYLISYLDEPRVLYLDSDIVVDGNLSEMYWRDFGDVLLLAVEDYVHNHIPVYTDMDLMPYFNSGVMLINNQEWKKYSVDAQLLAINQQYPHLTYSDQDALNIFFKGYWAKLPIEYNYQVDAIIELSYRRKQENLAKESGYLSVVPKIIHYTSQYKPWKSEFSQLMREKYWFYYGLEWKDILLRHPR
ncbi:glycosyltransferase family 8 protein [Mannheimia indoligenes]|uniref:glycosyltransferase family 8 protein n=1 Tax=Mannheimia indoligenes TaxID=3103145 RepID=UPI002FE5DB03